MEEYLGPHVAKPEDQKASPLGQALEDMLLRAKEEYDEDRYLASLMADGLPKSGIRKLFLE